MRRKIVASLTLLLYPINKPVGRALRNQQLHIHHGLEVLLERTSVDIGTQALEVLDGKAAVFKDESGGLGLPIKKAMFLCRIGWRFIVSNALGGVSNSYVSKNSAIHTT